MIKKLIFSLSIALLTSATVIGQAENYGMIKVDLGALYALPGSDGLDGGVGIYIEPKFNITDNIAIGLKWESAFLAYVSTFGGSKATTLRAIGITGDYYVGTNKFRPFAGLHIGSYKLADIDIGGFKVETDSKIGFTPRIGFTAGHFRMALEYNIVSDLDYFAIKAGWEIGGGPK